MEECEPLNWFAIIYHLPEISHLKELLDDPHVTFVILHIQSVSHAGIPILQLVYASDMQSLKY